METIVQMLAQSGTEPVGEPVMEPSGAEESLSPSSFLRELRIDLAIYHERQLDSGDLRGGVRDCIFYLRLAGF